MRNRRWRVQVRPRLRPGLNDVLFGGQSEIDFRSVRVDFFFQRGFFVVLLWNSFIDHLIDGTVGRVITLFFAYNFWRRDFYNDVAGNDFRGYLAIHDGASLGSWRFAIGGNELHEAFFHRLAIQGHFAFYVDSCHFRITADDQEC